MKHISPVLGLIGQFAGFGLMAARGEWFGAWMSLFGAAWCALFYILMLRD